MAHSLQARKRVRQTERHTERNKPFRTRAAHAVRDARNAIMHNEDGAGDLVRAAQSALDRHRPADLAPAMKAARGARRCRLMT